MNALSDVFQIDICVYMQKHTYVHTHMHKYFLYACHFPQVLILATPRPSAKCCMFFSHVQLLSKNDSSAHGLHWMWMNLKPIVVLYFYTERLL